MTIAEKRIISHDGTHVLASWPEGVVVQRSCGGRYLFGTPPHLRFNIIHRGGEGILLALGDGILGYVVAKGADLKKSKKKNKKKQHKNKLEEEEDIVLTWSTAASQCLFPPSGYGVLVYVVAHGTDSTPLEPKNPSRY